MAFLDAAKSLKAAAMTDTTVHNLTVTRLDVGHDHGPVSCGWEAPPGRRGRHMAGGASSCSAARHREAEPLCTDRKVVERQCQTSSCRARSAGCGQAGLCASGSGGEWERAQRLFAQVEASASLHADRVTFNALLDVACPADPPRARRDDVRSLAPRPRAARAGRGRAETAA